MKRIFLIGVIAYAISSLLLDHWPNAIAATGREALPWMAIMLIDLAFAGVAMIKLVGPSFFEIDLDKEVSVNADDFNVPDSSFYGSFGFAVLVNFVWHGYKFAVTTGVESFGFSMWFLIEAVALLLTFMFFKAAQKAAKRAARNAKAFTQRTSA